jgi:hypothetical protein
VSFQGQLLDPSGEPRNGVVTLQFSIFTALTDGTQLWQENHSGVPVVDGVFQVLLGSVSPLDPTTLASDDLWLEVVADGETLAPRQRVVSAAFAIRAQGADQLLQACGEGEVLRHVAGAWQCSALGACAPAALCPPGEFLRGCDAGGSPVCSAPEQALPVIAVASPLSGPAPLFVGLSCFSAGADPPVAYDWLSEME